MGLFELALSQNCSLISNQEILDLLYEYHPSFDEGQPNIFLVNYNITCLSRSIVKDRYSFVTISVKYMNWPQGFKMNETFVAVIDIGCTYDNKWNSDVLGNTAMIWSEPIPSVVLRTDCRSCNRAVNNSDPITHCVGEYYDSVAPITMSVPPHYL